MRWTGRPLQSRKESRDSKDGLLGTPTGEGPGMSWIPEKREENGHVGRDKVPLGDKPLVKYGVVGFYIFAAVLMFAVNKWVLLSTPVPIFFALAQQTFASLLLYTTHLLGWLHLPPLRWSTAKDLWPLVGLTVLNLAWATVGLEHVDNGWYQIALRGVLLPTTVGVARWVGVEKVGKGKAGCVGVVWAGGILDAIMDYERGAARREAGAGAAVGAGVGEMVNVLGVGEPRPRNSHHSILIGLLSALTTASHATIILRSLPLVSGSTIHLAWYTNALSALGLAPLVLLAGEVPLVMDILGDTDKLGGFLVGTVITGMVGFFVCVAGFLSVKATSPTTHMVSTATRTVFQTGLSAWLYGARISRPRIASIIIISIGSFCYALVNR